MGTFFKNIFLVFSNYRYFLLFLILFSLMFLIFEYLTDDLLIKGNQGLIHYYITFWLQVGISFLFSTFSTFFIYKYITFSSVDKKSSSTSFFGTFLAILVGGCPACSITLASYLGLASIVTLLPYDGLELKVLGFFMLLYANYVTIKGLQVCNIGFNSKKKSP